MSARRKADTPRAAAAARDGERHHGGRRALLAGATGLTGSCLLQLLLTSRRYSEVHVLARRPLATRHPKVSVHVVDFDALGQLRSPAAVDDVFVCLGTTIRAAGSQAAFRRVDLDCVVAVARLGLARGATRLAAISAMGANANSPVFYNRVKGEAEAALAGLGFESVTLVRPSLLAGERAEARPGERLALAFALPLAPLIPKRYRAVPAEAVARAMLHFVVEGAPGLQVVESDRIQGFVRNG
jgi:uncharacterized protein YbjT (DUF2867 family)